MAVVLANLCLGPVWHRGAELCLMLLDLLLPGIRPPILTVSSSSMLAELACLVLDFSKSKLSPSSKAGWREFVFPLPFPFCVLPRGMSAWELEKTATLMCEISVCLFLSVLLSSVQVLGLTQDIVPSQAVWEKLAVVLGKKECYFCRALNPAPLASAASFFIACF